MPYKDLERKRQWELEHRNSEMQEGEQELLQQINNRSKRGYATQFQARTQQRL